MCLEETSLVSYQVEIDMGSLSQAAIQDAAPQGLQVGLREKRQIEKWGSVCWAQKNELRREEPGTNTCSWDRDEPHLRVYTFGGGAGAKVNVGRVPSAGEELCTIGHSCHG